MGQAVAEDIINDSVGVGSAEPSSATFRTCNLCASCKRRLRYEIDGYHIVECNDCSLNYVAEFVSSDALVAYYGDAYYNGRQPKGYTDYIGKGDARRAHYRSLLPSIRRHLQANEVRALDVGCAAGFFLEVAHESGWSACGVELSPHMSKYAREERHLDVLTGGLLDVDLPKGAFDLITLWDVIEHLADPYATLRRAHNLMAPSGVLVIATGDISGATATLYGSRWALLAPPGHLFYFSRKTLFAMLRRAGFEPLEWQSDGAFLINDSDREEDGMLRSAVNRLHRSRYVNAALRRLKLGSIMTVFARKCGTN